MRKRLFVLLSSCLVVIATTLLQIKDPLKKWTYASGVQERLGVPDPTNARIIETYSKLPLSFEANQGQTDSEVRFSSRGNGYSLFLTSTEAVLSLKKPGDSRSHDHKGAITRPDQQERLGPLASARGLDWLPAPFVKSVDEKSSDEGAVLRMQLVGANPSPQVTGLDELPGKSNYFIGNDPAKWRTNVPTYAKVRYKNVYSGIDLVYYGHQRQLEYDFVVAPGADPRAIRLDFDGEEKLQIDAQGDLVVEAEGSDLRLHRPIIYQEISGTRQRISGNFVIHGRQVGFEVARYDASKPLIIDPVLSYSTYLGGSGQDRGYGIAVDSSGDAYVTGNTLSTNFPTANAFRAAYGGSGAPSQFGRGDAFVTKLNAAGSALVYSTYLGGSGGDSGYGIAVDSSGNAYVTGTTSSKNFPTANAFQATYGGSSSQFGGDAFVTKLNASGSLVYSTYLGGSGDDGGNGIAVDSSGDAYVTGWTDSTDFPTAHAFQVAYGGSQDVFVTKLNAAGSAQVYSTYLGGSGGDSGYGIAVDSSGNAYVTGSTSSKNFPIANAFQATYGGDHPWGNGFVTKLNAEGSALAYSTYLSGTDDEYGTQGNGIAVDSFGSAYVTGWTDSCDFPVTANAFQTACGYAFVTKLSAAGSALIYSTHLGRCCAASGIAVDSSGNAYVTGWTNSTDFPTANAFQAAYGGDTCGTASPCWDGFVTKLNAAGSALIYSTYLGGSDIDLGYGIAVDSSGNAYVTGTTCSADFPTANAFQAAFGGPSGFYNSGGDAFVTKFPAVADHTPQLSMDATQYCVGTSWNLKLRNAPPITPINLLGTSNGQSWKIHEWRTTDASGSMTEEGKFAEGTLGQHTLHIEIAGSSSNTVSFTVSSCKP